MAAPFSSFWKRNYDPQANLPGSTDLNRQLNELKEVQCTCVEQFRTWLAEPQFGINSTSWKNTRLYRTGNEWRGVMPGVKTPLRWLNSPGSRTVQRTTITDGEARTEFIVVRTPRVNEEYIEAVCNPNRDFSRGF